MQPPPGAVDVAGGFVDVDHVRQHDQRLDQLLDVDQHVGDGGQHRADPAGRGPRPGQVGDQRLRCGRPGRAGTPADTPPARAGSGRTPRPRPPRPAPPRSSSPRSRSGGGAAGARPRPGRWSGCRGPGGAPPRQRSHRPDQCRSHHTRPGRDRRPRPGRWSGTTPTRPRRAACRACGRCAAEPHARATPRAHQPRAAARSCSSCGPAGASAPRPRPATARSSGPAPRSTRGVPHATAAPTRTPHMISTPRLPGHAPTRRKITEPGPEWLPMRCQLRHVHRAFVVCGDLRGPHNLQLRPTELKLSEPTLNLG